jgi:hypothetical protein
MRWALLSVALLLAVAGLLYRGGVAFVSTLSDATALLRVDGAGTVAATPGWVEAPARPPPAEPMTASGMPRAEPSPVSPPQPLSNPEDPPPVATDQRVLKSRKALETVDPRDLVGQVP